MSSRHYEPVSSDDEERRLEIDESESGPSKRKRPQKRRPPVSESEEEEEARAPLPPKKKATSQAPSHSKQAPSLPSEEQKWQEVKEKAMAFMTPLKVDASQMTMLLDQATLECFRKACQSWLNEQKLNPTLTYSTQKTFVTCMARFVWDFTLKSCRLEGKPGINVSGTAIWTHHCTEDGVLRCFHGNVMLQKEQVVEMDVASENGQRALKEQPEKARITTNRWGRNIVQLRNGDAVCCPEDAAASQGSFGAKSCGLAYNEGTKALMGFNQIMSYQQACYPRMPLNTKRMLLPVKCDCNYLSQGGVPLVGRQLPKITPFNLNVAQSLDENQIDDPALKASVQYPVLLVFQCCNPVYRASRGSANGKNCDFKISAPDFMRALQMAKRMWAYFHPSPASVLIPEFKWQSQYQVQTSVLPTPCDDNDDCLY